MWKPSRTIGRAAVFEYRGLWPVVVIINVSRSVGPEFGPEDLNWIRHGGGSPITATDHVSARAAVASTPAPNGKAT